MEGYELFFDPLRIEIAIARGELAEVERKLSEWAPRDFRDVEGLVAWLNALVALQRGPEIEEKVPRLLRGGRTSSRLLFAPLVSRARTMG